MTVPCEDGRLGQLRALKARLLLAGQGAERAAAAPAAPPVPPEVPEAPWEPAAGTWRGRESCSLEALYSEALQREAALHDLSNGDDDDSGSECGGSGGSGSADGASETGSVKSEELLEQELNGRYAVLESLLREKRGLEDQLRELHQLTGQGSPPGFPPSSRGPSPAPSSCGSSPSPAGACPREGLAGVGGGAHDAAQGCRAARMRLEALLLEGRQRETGADPCAAAGWRGSLGHAGSEDSDGDWRLGCARRRSGSVSSSSSSDGSPASCDEDGDGGLADALRALRRAPEEQRRTAIQAMPQDQFMKLISGFGDLPREAQRRIYAAGCDSDDSEDGEDGEDSEDGKDAEDEAQPAPQLRGGPDTPAAPAAATASAICRSSVAPAAPNVQPLGRLQVGGSRPQARPPPSGACRAALRATWAGHAGGLVAGRRTAAALCESGVDGSVIREWLDGEISGDLCRARVLEGVARGRFSTADARREVSRAAGLYGRLGDGLGGPLGALAGGFAAVATLGSGGAGVLPPTPELAVSSAKASLCPEVEDDGLDAEAVSLEFRRRCLQVHPQRELGSLDSYLRVRCHLEVVRQSLLVASAPLAYPGPPQQPVGAEGLAQIEAELGRSCAESATAAADLSDAGLQAWNARISDYLLDLAWQKDCLTSMLEQMRATEAYEVLGVSPDATDAELAKAYKLAAMRSHPDKGGDPEQFKVLRTAYDRILAERKGCKDASGPRGGTGEAPSGDSPPTPPAAAAGAPAPGEGADAPAPPPAADEAAPAPVDAEDAPEACSPRSGAEAGAEAAEAAPAGAEGATEASAASSGTEAEDSEDDEGEEAGPAAAAAHAPAEAAAGGGGPGSGGRSCAGAGAGAGGGPERAGLDVAELIRGIPVEAVATQAELCLDAAEMCAKVAKMAEEAAEAGGRGWPQLLRCGTHLLDSSHCATEAARSIARCASGIPSDVIPLLDRVKTTMGIDRKVMNVTRDLMRCTEVISERGLQTARLSDRLLEHSKEVLQALRGAPAAAAAPGRACLVLADALRALAGGAREAADAAAATATAVGDAQCLGQTLAEMVEKLRKSRGEAAEEKPKRGAGTEDGEADSSDEEEEEQVETPASRRRSNRQLLLELNSEVCTLQGTMRSLTAAKPHLLPAVGVAQKEAVFGLVAELTQRWRRALSAAWRAGASAAAGAAGAPGSDSAAAAAAWADAAESVALLVRSAGAWDVLASPRLEARILRAAALIDGRLLSEMLEGELLGCCCAAAAPPGAEAAAGGTEAEGLGARLAASIAALCRHGA